MTTGAIGKRLDRLVVAADARLTLRRAQVYPIFMLAVGAGFYLGALALGHPPFDVFGHPIAIDLSNRLTAGTMVLHGDVGGLYDVKRQVEVQRALLGGQHPEFLDVYISPPFVAYVYAPLAALPYEVAAALWTMLTIGLLIVDLRLLWPLVANLHRYRFRAVLLIVFSSWPVIELLADGQDAAVSLLVLLGGLHLLRARRDLTAGALLGLGAFKPQLFLLIPLLLLLQRRWRALTGWLAVSMVLLAASALLLGPAGIHSYVVLITSTTFRQAIFATLGWKMQSVLAFVSALVGSPSGLAVTAIWAGVDAVLLVAFVRTARRVREGVHELELLYALAVLTGAMVSPYFFMYDCVILVRPALLLLNHAPSRPASRLSLAAAYILTWTAPLRYLVFGRLPGPLPIVAAPWAVVALLALLWSGYQLIPRNGTRVGGAPASSLE